MPNIMSPKTARIGNFQWIFRAPKLSDAGTLFLEQLQGGITHGTVTPHGQVIGGLQRLLQIFIVTERDEI